MSYLFTSESVSEGHPDKVCDQLSDAILDALLEQDPNSRVACECMATTGLVVVAGEITTKANVDYNSLARTVLTDIGYTGDDMGINGNSCGVMISLDRQSADIAMGVDREGAGDQGMMFGYATKETPEYLPMALAYSHRLVQELANIRKQRPELMPYLRPDAKAQVTVAYGENDTPQYVHTVVVSTQHDDFIKPDNSSPEAIKQADKAMLERIEKDVIEHVVKKVIPNELLRDTIFHINPTGKFVIGGPHGDAGLTGRKIIVDTYGGKGAHGGGAFSGKDPSKVDRSAAYATRHIAKNMVAAGLADEVLVQVSYAIGVAKPMGIYVNTYGTAKKGMKDGEIAKKIEAIFDMRPYAVEQRLKLRNPIYEETAAYGHMGRKNEVVTKTFVSPNGTSISLDVELFTWEKLDYVERLQKAFGVQ